MYRPLSACALYAHSVVCLLCFAWSLHVRVYIQLADDVVAVFNEIGDYTHIGRCVTIMSHSRILPQFCGRVVQLRSKAIFYNHTVPSRSTAMWHSIVVRSHRVVKQCAFDCMQLAPDNTQCTLHQFAVSRVTARECSDVHTKYIHNNEAF